MTGATCARFLCSQLLLQPYILNPTFAGSVDVSGADADLIVNGCLIDIKSTINPKVDPNWLRQLIGYVLLDYDNEHHIDSVGIYMSRQGEMFTWSLTEFLGLLSGDNTISLSHLREEFRTLCQPQRPAKYQRNWPSTSERVIRGKVTGKL